MPTKSSTRLRWIRTGKPITDPFDAATRNAGSTAKNGKLVSRDSFIIFEIKFFKLDFNTHYFSSYYSWLARTDPADVARVESRTFVVTSKRSDAIPSRKEGVAGTLGNWMSPDDLHKSIQERFPNCMKGNAVFITSLLNKYQFSKSSFILHSMLKFVFLYTYLGRTMYVIPFSMGPVGSPLSKIGIELTDSPYVVASMRVMTRMGRQVLETLGDEDFVRCLHSVGCPLPLTKPIINNWPCNPEQTIIMQCPDTNEILSYGSGYGGNSLLGKKCFALRIGSVIAKKEGWLAEHMLVSFHVDEQQSR